MNKLIARFFFVSFTLCLVFAFSGVIQQVKAQEDFSKTYESIAKGIYIAKGRAFIDLTPGQWQTTVGNTPSTQSRVIWEVKDNTLVRTNFDYAAGALQSANAEFMPSVRVTIRKGSKCLSYDINRIKYTNVGRVLPPTIDGPNPDWVRNPPCNDITTLRGELEKHLEFSAAPEKLFLGNSFAGSRENPLPTQPIVGGVPGSPRPMITRLQFYPAVENGVELPALEVQFRDNTNLTFGRNSSMSLKGGSGFKFERLNYDVLDKAAEGRLHTFRLNLFSAKFETGNTKLIIEPNSSSEPAMLEISNVIFYPNERKVELENGNVVAAITDGTKFSVDSVSDDKQSYLNFKSGRIILRDISATVFDNQAESFGFREAEVENVFLHKGQLFLTQDQFLTFQKTTLKGHLNKCRWGQGGFVFSANIKELGGQIIGGELKPNSESLIKLASGSVHTTSLTIESGTSQRVTGEFDDLTFTLAADSLLAMPGKFEITPRPGATFIAATAVNPFKMSPLKNGPSGVLDVNLQAERIKTFLGKVGFFNAREGELKGAFAFAPDEPVKGRIDKLTLTGGSGSFRVNGATNFVSITNGVLKGNDLKTGGSFGLTGVFEEISFNIPESNSFTIPGVLGITTRTDEAAPAKFEAKRPLTGIELRDELTYPIGNFIVHLPYLRLTTDVATLNERLELDGSNNGNADLKIAYDENGNISGKDATINGVLSVSVMGIGLNVPVNITRGEFRTSGNTPVFGGHVVAIVPPVFKYPGGVKTSYQQNVDLGNDRFKTPVAFPVDIDVSLQKDLKIESDFAIAGGLLNLTALADGVFNIVIPSKLGGQGGGEHVDRLDLSKGTKDEDEDYGRWQEAFVTDFDPPVLPQCTGHIYLKDRSYTASAKVSIRVVNNKFGAVVSDIRPDRIPEVHRDGCDSSLTAVIVGTVTLGPFGAVAGKTLSEVFDKIVDWKINGLIADKLTSLTIKIGNQDVSINVITSYPTTAKLQNSKTRLRQK